ncbi:MAG: 2Fe-2S iron-sulfur cluster-binding protein [Candidatus Nanopelagicales bacterium]
MPQLRVVPEDVTVEMLDGETVLECLYRHGYAYRVGCRRGGCGVCKVDLLEGAVDYSRPVADKVLPAEERAAGTCLSCRAVALGDLTISLREDVLRQVNPLMALFASARGDSNQAVGGRQ